MCKKNLILIVIFGLFFNINVYAEEEYINTYIDIDVPQEQIDEYEKYLETTEQRTFYFQTDSNGNVTTASIDDETYSSVDMGYITPVKNQMSTGSCWAHAGMSVLETAAILSGNATTSLDLSEMHLVYGTNALAFSDMEIKNRYYLGGPLSSSNNGGNIVMTAAYLFSGLGAVKNELFPLKSYSSYGANDVKPVNSNGREVQITTEEYASIPSKPEFYINNFYRIYGTKSKCSNSIENIKRMILNYGSVQVSIDSQTANYHNTYYFVNTSSTTTNHAVTLVGWDDTIEASKFGFTDESKKGAWIMKNSWGTSKGNKGYYYVSYYDNTVCSIVSTFDGIDTNEYDYVYDSTGMYLNSNLFRISSKTVYQASVFENEGNIEALEKVAFAVNPGYSYVIYYAPYNNGGWKSGVSNWTAIGTLNSTSFYGIQSVDVSQFDIKINEKYVIIIKGTKPNTSSYNSAVITYKDKTYVKNTISTTKMELVEDESYYSTNGTSWTDLYNYSYEYDVACDSDGDGKIAEVCKYSSTIEYDGAQNVIYAYTKEEQPDEEEEEIDVDPEITISANIINSNNQSVSKFYSFDDSKFKLDTSSISKNIESFYPVITNSKGQDYTSYFAVSVDNTNKQILISTASNKYIPVDTYSFTLYYDLGNTGNFDYKIYSTLTVTKPFAIKSLSVETSDGLIYPDTSFKCLLKDYASTLNSNSLTFTIKLNSTNKTSSFNISYSNGEVLISPKSSIDVGTYTLAISINGNDSASINFEVHTAYTMSISPVADNLVINPDVNHEYTVSELESNITSHYGYSILDSNNHEITPEIIGTGMKLKLNTTSTESIIYTFVIVGDITGDGKISSKDYVRLWNHLDRSNSFTLTDDSLLKAADLSNDGRLTAADYVRLWNQLSRG